MDTREPQAGDIATLNEPYLGYRRIELIENAGISAGPHLRERTRDRGFRRRI